MANVTKEQILALREKTGVGMMDCKKALQEAGGDMEKAIDILRKKGASVAAKRADKSTAEGLVYSYIHPGSRVGVMVELNCETDFVARTDDMKQAAADIGMHIAAIRPLYLSPEDVDPKLLERETKLFKEQLLESGKPEKIIDKIVEGKVNKLYTELCLLKQPFVKNDQLTVEDLIQQLVAKLGENIKIKRFARFEIGI